MSLAAVQVPTSDFQYIHTHLTTHPRASTHRNMHLRERCQRSRRWDLRYLHAMHAPPTNNMIEGVISGPGVFWQYRLTLANGKTQMQVLYPRASQREEARIERRFLPEIMARVQEERTRTQFFAPPYAPGQLYLRRLPGGIAANDPRCVSAVQSGVLDRRFVSVLAGWNLTLR